MSAKLKVEVSASADGFIKTMGNAKKEVEGFSSKTEDAGKTLDEFNSKSGSASRAADKLSNAQKKAAMEALQHSRAVKNATKELKNMESTANSAMGSISGAMSSLQSGDFMGFASNIKNAGLSIQSLIPASTAGVGALGGLSTAFTGLGAAITTALGPAGLIAAAVAAVAGITYKAISASENYNKSLKSFASLTGMTGGALDDMGDRAKNLGEKYGVAATEVLDSMTIIGSQAPQLLQDADAMEQVTEAANVLSRAAGIDVTEAASGLTTVMNQMGVSASEASEIINTLAAGSAEGAGDVAYLQTAIEKSGTIAKNSGMDYHELVGAIETLAPKFSSAEVAGTALKGTLLKLTTQTNSNFNPAVVGINKALENLANANLSASEMTKMFGESNVTAASILIQSRGEFEKMTKSVTDTNTAYDQMETQSGSLAGEWNKLKTACENLWIEIGNTEPMKIVVALIKAIIFQFKVMMDTIRMCIKVWQTMVNIVKALLKKFYDNCIKPWIDKIRTYITDTKLYKGFVKIWNKIKDVAFDAIKYVTDLWKKFMNWLGISTSEIKLNAKVDAKVDEVDVSEASGDLNLGDTNVSGGGKGGSSSKDAIKQALADYEAEKLVLQNKLNTGLIQQTEYDQGILDAEKKLIEVKAKNNKLTQEDVALYNELKSRIESNVNAEEEIAKAVKESEKATEKANFKKENGLLSELDYNNEILSISKKLLDVKIEYSKATNDDVVNYKEINNRLEERKKLLEEEKKIANDRLKLEEDLTNTIKSTNTGRKVSISETVERKYHNTGVTSSSSSSGKELNYVIGKYDELKSKIDEAKASGLISPEKITEAENALDDLGSKIDDLASKTNSENLFGNIQNALGGLSNVGNYISNIGETFSDCEKPIDYFTSGLNAVIQTLQLFQTIMTTINTVQAIFNALSATSAAATTATSAATTAKAATDAAAIPSAVALTAANKALETSYLTMASAAIFAAHAAIPFVGVGIASGLITSMMGAMAAFTASATALAAFKQGGIVEGSTTVGDSVLTRLNKGEMVLNTRQQSHLFNMLNHSTIGNGNSNGELQFKIKGSDLVGTIKNYNKKHNSSI